MKDVYLIKISEYFKLNIEDLVVKEAIHKEVKEYEWWWSQRDFTEDIFKTRVTTKIQDGFNNLKNHKYIFWGAYDNIEGLNPIIEILGKYNLIVKHYSGIKDFIQIINIGGL